MPRSFRKTDDVAESRVAHEKTGLPAREKMRQLVPPQLFVEIVQQSPLAISITDNRACILYVNPAFEKLTGYEANEVLGKNESLLSHKQTPKRVYEGLWSTIHDKRNWHGNLVNRRADGDAYLAELNISPVLDVDGNISNFLGIHRDVTEMHALEKQVHHQKALIESVFDAAPVVVSLLDTQRHVLLENQAYKRLCRDLGGISAAQMFLQALQQEGVAVCEGENFSGREVRLDIQGRAEPRWFSVSASWVDELDNTAGSYFVEQSVPRLCLLLVASEITALKHQHEQARMQHLRAGLAEHQRVQDMREALSCALFQLQTPLNVIQAVSGMLDRGADLNKARDVLDQVLESGAQAMETLRSALPAELQESETGVNLNALLQDVLILMTDDFLAHGVVIDWQPQAVLPTVQGRPNQLRSVFMRLMENALLALAEAAEDQPCIGVRTQVHGDYVEVLVQDNGLGIPEALRLKVFEPFFSVWQHTKKRAGMGLTMVQETINQHGGTVDINPSFGKGCQLRVNLPTIQKKHGLEGGER